jgi:hypothetical protein
MKGLSRESLSQKLKVSLKRNLEILNRDTFWESI